MGILKFQSILINKGGEAIQYLFDNYPAFFGVSSARHLKSDITDIERDRRSSDDAEDDFTPLEKTDGSLLTFTGAGDGFTTQPYDQSGNAFAVTQATKPSQPQSVDTGVLVTSGGKAAWDNAGKFGWSSSSNLVLSDASEIWIFGLVEIGTVTSTEVIFQIGDITSDEGAIEIVVFNGGTIGIQQRKGAGTIFYQSTNTFTGRQLIAINIKTNTDVGSAWDMWVNDTLQVNQSPSTGDTVVFTDAILSVLVRDSGLNPFEGKAQELLIYKGDQSANRAAIEANINAYYNIY